MKKTLYSHMLSDEVVREVDALAHRMGTNRSNLINQILADYVSVTTPERRINDIFRAVEQMLAPSRELVPFFAPNALTMSLKSSLEYKYRPTVKYEVQLFRSGEGSLVGVSAAKPRVLRHMAKQRTTEKSAESLRFIWFGPPLWPL